MKTRFPILAAVLLAAHCWMPAAYAQSGGVFDLRWSTIDGGGGTSSGGVYAVSGTVGQPDAGRMNGGNFTLVGGFWSIVAALQTEGAPPLSIARSNAAVVIFWPAPAEGWVLQITTNLLSTGSVWTDRPPPYQVNGPNLQVLEPSPAGRKFYRLHKP